MRKRDPFPHADEAGLTCFVLLPSGCWQWTGFINNDGYARVTKGYYYHRVAHRALWEHLFGPLPRSLQLDHLCRNRSCVNPAHLEPVTCRENLLRGVGYTAVNAAKTHCVRGHPLVGDNLYITPNGRHRSCRACKALWARENRVDRRAA